MKITIDRNGLQCELESQEILDALLKDEGYGINLLIKEIQKRFPPPEEVRVSKIPLMDREIQDMYLEKIGWKNKPIRKRFRKKAHKSATVKNAAQVNKLPLIKEKKMPLNFTQPATGICLNCKKKFDKTGRLAARYCSDECKKEYKMHHKVFVPEREPPIPPAVRKERNDIIFT